MDAFLCGEFMLENLAKLCRKLHIVAIALPKFFAFRQFLKILVGMSNTQIIRLLSEQVAYLSQTSALLDLDIMNAIELFDRNLTVSFNFDDTINAIDGWLII
jgi:uncharacterized membrane protein